MSAPVAYIRRSSADAGSPGDISRDVQESAIRELAARDGHNGDVRIFVDWARSADEEKIGKRTEYAAMLAEVEGGRVSTIYAYALDRLQRSVIQTSKLVKACEAHGVRIVTQREGEVRHDTPDEWLRFTTLATFAEFELRTIKKRAQAAIQRRAARGDALGKPPYGYQFGRDDTKRVILLPDPQQPLQPVLDAFNEAGSFNGAARLLNERGMPAPRGGKWAGNVVNNIVRRERPGLVPRHRSEARVAPRGTHLFSRLLRCSCGRMLTPRVNRKQVTKYGTYGPYIGYQCYAGRHDPDHPRPYMVSERLILDWAIVEAARFRAPDRVMIGKVDAAKRAALDAERERIGWAVVRGAIPQAAGDARLDEIDAELDALADVEAVMDVPSIDWQRTPPHAINAVLRALWDYVQLGDGMRPVRAAWRLPPEYIA
jgi:DNA invertase Pin-like site-specific DNA recombinase